MLDAHGINGARVVTVDIKPAVEEHDPRVTYITGSARNLDMLLPADMVASLPRPWLVVDDGSHLEDDIVVALDWLHPRLQSGDYLVVEDGSLRWFTDPIYDLYNDGPNRAVASFLQKNGADYEIDQEMCDWYGQNVTWNPNAWLRRR
jgi:cephalosporin hydroxylase